MYAYDLGYTDIMGIIVLIFILIISVFAVAYTVRSDIKTAHKSVKTETPLKKAHLIRYDNDERDVWGDTNSAGQVEQYVTQELLRLGENYFIFQNVILPSAYTKMPYTEIDHIIVSPFGIFCVETKSHKGSIYGNKASDQWKQYLYNDKSYTLHNPLRQSHAHTEALKKFLGGNLKSNIHCYVVFPKARNVKVNSTLVTNDIHEIIDRISNHQTRLYDFNELERMLKSLAHYDSKHLVIQDKHIEGVRNYVGSKSR